MIRMRRRRSAQAQIFLGWLVLGGLAWDRSLLIATAVLIITCPCALALAIPAVQVVASGRLFRNGIILNAGDGIEPDEAEGQRLMAKAAALGDEDATAWMREHCPEQPQWLRDLVRGAQGEE